MIKIYYNERKVPRKIQVHCPIGISDSAEYYPPRSLDIEIYIHNKFELTRIIKECADILNEIEEEEFDKKWESSIKTV